MSPQDIFQLLRETFGEQAVLEFVETGCDPFVVLDRSRLVEICRFLRDDSRLDFAHLSLVTGLDWPEHFESVAHLVSYSHHHHLTVKVRMPKAEGEPRCPSLSPVWRAADWHEREQYDMLGIIYEGHPDLRRILLAEDWEGFPLRKDYVPPAEYNGVSNLP